MSFLKDAFFFFTVVGKTRMQHTLYQNCDPESVS